MKRLLLLLACSVVPCVEIYATDFEGLESIGAVVNHSTTSSDIIFNCRDSSQVQITVLAPDLVRVRATYGKPLPQRDHSWAIAKVNWEHAMWQLNETFDSFIVITSELQVIVNRSPLVIEFRDAKTGRTINADARPMAFDPNGSTVAAAKKLGFDEHFYGLGEKAARLDKRRGQFTMWNSDTPGYSEGTDPIYQSIPLLYRTRRRCRLWHLL